MVGKVRRTFVDERLLDAKELARRHVTGAGGLREGRGGRGLEKTHGLAAIAPMLRGIVEEGNAGEGLGDPWCCCWLVFIGLR